MSLKINAKTPENTKIASYLGVKEGTIRARKKKYQEEDDLQYLQNVNDYIKNKKPFYTIDEYISIENIEKNKDEIIYEILKGEFPGIIQDDNVFIPTIIEDFNMFIEPIKECFPIVLTNSNHKGGVAKSTNTANLAATYAFLGLKVLIVDFDPQGNVSQSFGVYEGKTVVDLIFNLNDNNIEEQVRETIIDLNIENKFKSKINGCLHLLSNNDDMVDRMEDLPSLSKEYGTVEKSLKELLSYVNKDYDIILIDTPPRADLILRTALLASDYVVLSLKAEPFAKTGMPKIIHNIYKYEKAYQRENGKKLQILGGILSAYEKNVNLQKTNADQIREDLQQETDYTAEVFNTYIPKATIIPESQQGEGAVLLYTPDDEVVKCYMDISMEIFEKILINVNAQ